MPKRESVRWDRLSPVFASAFNGSVSVGGGVATDRMFGRFEKERCCVASARISRLACDAGDLRARERSYSDEWERTDVRLMSDLPESSERAKIRISKLHCFEVLFFSVPIAGAIGCSLSRVPGRFVFGLDFKVKIREDSLVIGDYPQHSDTEREQAEKRPADHAELHEK